MNELGEVLKAARSEQGYTLDDLQQMTKIQKRYLQAIEEGRSDLLPGQFYTRAFVKQYADIVGLDGEELLAKYLNENKQATSEELGESMRGIPTRTQGKSANFFSGIHEHLPTLLIFLLVVAIFAVIYYAFRQYKPGDDAQLSMINEADTEQVATEGDEAAEDGNTDASDSGDDEAAKEQLFTISESTGSSTVYTVKGPHPKEQTVILTADGGDSWVSITVTGGESKEGLLKSGQSLEMTFGADAKEVAMVIGNAPVTEVTLNDTELEYAPEASAVVRQDLQLQFVE